MPHVTPKPSKTPDPEDSLSKPDDQLSIAVQKSSSGSSNSLSQPLPSVVPASSASGKPNAGDIIRSLNGTQSTPIVKPLAVKNAWKYPLPPTVFASSGSQGSTAGSAPNGDQRVQSARGHGGNTVTLRKPLAKVQGKEKSRSSDNITDPFSSVAFSAHGKLQSQPHMVSHSPNIAPTSIHTASAAKDPCTASSQPPAVAFSHKTSASTRASAPDMEQDADPGTPSDLKEV